MAERVLVNELYPYVEKSLSKKENVKKLNDVIASFIDRNNEALSAVGPTKLIMFTDKDRQDVFDIIGITEKMEKAARDKSKDIKNTGKTVARPLSITMTLITRYFSLHNNLPMVKLSVLYCGLSFYYSKYTKYFKFDPNEEIMAYTINNMSYKYKLKSKGSLLAAIDETYYGAYQLHRRDIERGNDKDIVDFILSMDTRINNLLKNICNEFMKNYKSGNYIAYEDDDNDPENFKMSSSSSHSISNLSDKITMRLITDGPPIKLVTAAARNNKVSVNELRNYLNTMIRNENRDEIKELIEAILFIYLFDKKNKIEDINSNKFITYTITLYRKSNANDKNIHRIKEILDSWLERLDIYKKTQRLATINDFRRALYVFFVMCISYYNVR